MKFWKQKLKSGSRTVFLGICFVQGEPRLPSPKALEREINRIVTKTDGKIGVALLEENGTLISVHGNQRFPMQSVYKVPIGMALLHAVDQKRLHLDQKVQIGRSELVSPLLHSPIREKYPRGEIVLSVRELLEFMIEESDGTASDKILALLGGPKAVSRFLEGLNIHGVTVATTEREMARNERVQYRNWTTPEAYAKFLRALYGGRGLSPASRALLLQKMRNTKTGAHRIKGLLPPGTLAAHKTGSSRTKDGLTRATNDAGFIPLPNGQTLIVVVFVSDSKADTASREGAIARISRQAWDYFSRPPLK